MNVLLSEIRRSLIELDKGNSTTVCTCLLSVISTSHKSFHLSCLISNSEIFHGRQFDLFSSLRILSKRCIQSQPLHFLSSHLTLFPLTSPHFISSHLNPSHSSLENIPLSFLAEKTFLSLLSGMKGQLNMSQPMEDLIKAIGINQWPGRNPFSQCRWESKAWPSMKNLLSEYNDMLLRVAQLVSWTSELVTPYSVWLPGLFNPTSYLTAVMQVTARRTGMPLDQMTTETHVTTFMRPETIDYYPTDGAFIHGLYIEGARWPAGDETGDADMVTGTPTAGNTNLSLSLLSLKHADTHTHAHA